MADEVTTPTEVEQQLAPEDQKALDRARGIKEDTNPYNDDGSPKEEPVEIPEKFQGKSIEDVIKAYTELEKKLSERPSDSQETSEKDTTISEKETVQEEETTVEDKVNATLTPQDFKKYEEAYISEGSLNEDHYKELAKKGLSKEIVDLYIEGAKARDTIYTNAIYEEAGGKEPYEELVKWASDNIKDVDVIAEVNKNLTSGNLSKAKMAVELLQAKRGTTPRKLEGTSGTDGGGIKAYRSKADWQKDVRSPLYGRDKKYTLMVDAKYTASKKKGTL